ncbi:MAG: ribosome assembly cofactor RimP [Bacteroidaceae bacterium]|nr:ribosome assembly cofactor RimP [Bacteroidaceae bacterium]
MIDKSFVTGLVNEWLEGNDYFLVDLSISPDSKIVVEIDHKDGVWIEDCVELSKFVEEHLDRDKEDFELEVGSAGIGQPFKVIQQYLSHIGDEVEVLDENKKIRGILKSVDGDEFVVTVVEKQKLEGQKKAQMVEVDKTFDMNKVKYTKYLINFK